MCARMSCTLFLLPQYARSPCTRALAARQMYELGCLYITGRGGVVQNDDEALRWWTKAAKAVKQRKAELKREETQMW